MRVTRQPDRSLAQSCRDWLDRPLSDLGCVLSWIGSSIVFVGMVAALGGPTSNDSSESIYSTWAIAHGRLACAYPPTTTITDHFFPAYKPSAPAAPLWPLISGALAAVTRIGHAVPFPSAQDMGSNCHTAYLAMYQWAGATRALLPTTGLGYASWLVLLAGMVALLRACGVGRTRWEALGVFAVAVLPVSWSTLLVEYHPQDLVAIGLVLAGLACVQRRQWVWAGVFMGLAVTSQQFALLAVVPVFLVASTSGRWRFLGGAIGSWGVVTVFMLAVTSGSADAAVVFGTGDASTYGGTVLWEIGARGTVLLFFSRVMPVIVAAVLAFWVRRRAGDRVLEPIPLLALVATTLSLRLVFEKGIFGYKFLALAVMLIMLDVVRRHIRFDLVVWLLFVTVVFNVVPDGLAVNARSWGSYAANGWESLCLVVALVVIVWEAVHRRYRWYLIGAFVIAAAAFAHWPLVSESFRSPWPLWFWQLVLLVPGVALALDPLLPVLRGGADAGGDADVDAGEGDGEGEGTRRPPESADGRMAGSVGRAPEPGGGEAT